MPIARVHPGDPLTIPAAAYNAFADAADAHRAAPSGATGRGSLATASGVVTIKNNSGAARSRFDVLGIDTPVVDPSTDLSAFQAGQRGNTVPLIGSTPAAAHAGRFAVLIEPAAASAYARAVVFGLAIVQLNVTDANHTHADISAGQTGYLASAATGAARILWKATGAGTKWSVVRIANAPPLGSMFAVKVWRDGPASDPTEGSKTAACNLTYTARTIDATGISAGGVLLGEDLSPVKRRWKTTHYGRYDCPPATGSGIVGTGYFASDGSFVLVDANEVPGRGACS